MSAAASLQAAPVVSITPADALACYPSWPAPHCIVADGAYGLAGFPGDPRSPEALPAWYAPHLAAWTAAAQPATALWFWNSEVGWATMHPSLHAAGWDYRVCHIWDKGKGHIAGRVNSNTARSFPIVTEVCVYYSRPAVFVRPDGEAQTTQQWLRAEWQRTGLPFSSANTACGVVDAASRKYLSADYRWYMPPPDQLARLTTYANRYGRPEGSPYFQLPAGLQAIPWERLWTTWNYSHGITNVWCEPALRGKERLKIGAGRTHPNQKPLRLMERIVAASTRPGDVVWEPFGGLGTAALAAARLGRACYSAEIDPTLASLARARLLTRAAA